MRREGDSAEIPLWNLEPIFPGFESEGWKRSKQLLADKCKDFTGLVNELPRLDGARWLRKCIDLYNECSDLFEELSAYAYARFSVDTRDETAQKELNELEREGLPLKAAIVRFRNVLATLRDHVAAMLEAEGELAKYRYFVEEQLRLQEKQMSPAEEEVAADLSRAGGDAWARLHEALSSNLAAAWDEEKGERKSVTELRSLAADPDRKVREKAFRLELAAWRSAEIPFAFALNGVKGFATILNQRRQYPSALDRAILQARITRKTLDALIGVMEESLPLFRRYLRAKASKLGLPKLAFFDLFAPVGEEVGRWSFPAARVFVLERFTAFAEELGALAKRAFDGGWIDAATRLGKVGGAYCISFPLAGESRILANWSGDFQSLVTIGHELGHAYHHEVLKRESAIHRQYPMTLAETASIFSESIIYSGALSVVPAAQRVTILEDFLQNCTQVVVDILSRFYFERELFERRPSGELSARELCEMMLDAQRRSYGDALEPSELHPYMWAVKGHYYNQDLGFYNFPYAFGQLFGLGLYSLYLSEGPSFAARYRRLLGETGRASALDVTRSVGFDIEGPEFWRQGFRMIEERIDEFIELTGTRA